MNTNLIDIESRMDTELENVTSWCDTTYQKHFSQYFSEATKLFKKMQSAAFTITDEELNWILITFPTLLFDVSENLSKIKLQHEVIKLKIKEDENECIKKSESRTVTQKKEDALVATLESRLLANAYATVIERVENELSFSKELIMGAKKIWDSRRKTENSNPVSEVETKLPEYRRPVYGV